MSLGWIKLDKWLIIEFWANFDIESTQKSILTQRRKFVARNYMIIRWILCIPNESRSWILQDTLKCNVRVSTGTRFHLGLLLNFTCFALIFFFILHSAYLNVFYLFNQTVSSVQTFHRLRCVSFSSDSESFLNWCIILKYSIISIAGKSSNGN